MIVGDTHLSSRNRGFHVDYPKESMYYFKEMTKTAIDENVDVLIGLGDLNYGNFNLSYRKEFEEELQKQLNQTKGNRYELKGNHDYDKNLTEYEFYISSGRLKGVESYNQSLREQLLSLGLNLVFLDYKDVATYKHERVEGCLNVVLAHQTLTFGDSDIVPEVVTQRIKIQDNPAWYGVDYLICGHIHTPNYAKGRVLSDDQENYWVTHLIYPGCPCRTAFNSNKRDEQGNITDEFDKVYRIFLERNEEGVWNINVASYPLLELHKCIQVDLIEREKERKDVLQLNDIVQRINQEEFIVNDFETEIQNQSAIPLEIRERAIELLKQARSE